MPDVSVEKAAAQMLEYCRRLAESNNDVRYLLPFYAINTLRGYKQMQDDGRLIDLSEHGTNTETAFAYFCSDTWDKEAFLAEWAKQKACVPLQ